MSFLAFVFGLAAATWMIPLMRSQRLLVCAMLVLIVGTVAGPALFAIDGPIQISIDRILFFALVATTMIGLRLGLTRLPKPHRADFLMLGVITLFLISAVSGGSDPPGTPPVAKWLFYIAMPAGMYFIARMVTIRVEDVRWIGRIAIVLGVYLSVTALLEIKGMSGLVFPSYIADEKNWEFLGRGRGPLLNPSGNGILISFGLTTAAVAILSASRASKLVLAAIIGCLLLGVYATLTRSAWIGGLSAIGIVMFVHSPRWVRTIGLLSVLALGAVATSDLRSELMRLKRDKNLSAEDAAKSVALRPLLAVVAWEMFKDKPILGHGYGHYMVKHKPYHQIRSYDMPLEQARPYHQHNVFLSVLVDTGLIGLALFGGWFVTTALMAWRLARDGSAIAEVRACGLVMLGTLLAYTSNGMFQDVMIIPMVHMYFFFLAGITITITQSGLVRSTANRNRAEERRTAYAPSVA